jgi:hypothetical protein
MWYTFQNFPQDKCQEITRTLAIMCSFSLLPKIHYLQKSPQNLKVSLLELVAQRGFFLIVDFCYYMLVIILGWGND